MWGDNDILQAQQWIVGARRLLGKKDLARSGTGACCSGFHYRQNQNGGW